MPAIGGDSRLTSREQLVGRHPHTPNPDSPGSDLILEANQQTFLFWKTQKDPAGMVSEEEGLWPFHVFSLQCSSLGVIRDLWN